MPIDKERIAELIPHAGAMCLLDEITRWDAQTVTAASRSHCDHANPLRTADGLSALSAIEYAAQAMAVHGALVGAVDSKPRTGYLVAVRNVVCAVARLDALDDALVIEARQMLADGERVMYSFALRIQEHEVLSGSATVVLDVERATP